MVNYPAKVIYLIFQALEVVSRYRDPQPQVRESYSCLFNPCPAELLQLYFSSFEAGIANATSASNDEKHYYL